MEEAVVAAEEEAVVAAEEEAVGAAKEEFVVSGSAVVEDTGSEPENEMVENM